MEPLIPDHERRPPSARGSDPSLGEHRPDPAKRFDVDRAAQRPLRPARSSRMPWVLLALAVLGVLSWLGWKQSRELPPAPPPPVAVAQPEPPATVTLPPTAPPPAPQHTLDSTAVLDKLPSLDQSDPVVRSALVQWLGETTVNSVLRSDDFVRRFVATVDNLGREHAAPRQWPVSPLGGKPSVQGAPGSAQSFGPANAARYDAFVKLVGAADPVRAATLYKQHYPLFQAAYRELGYPNANFNERLVAVIDRLLATPEPARPPAVRLVEPKGELASTMSATFYEFADPALERLPSGSKLLLRMGNDHARTLKTQLRAFRAEITKG